MNDTGDIMYKKLELQEEEIERYIEEAYSNFASLNVIDKALCDVVDKLYKEKFDRLKEINTLHEKTCRELRKENEKLRFERNTERADAYNIERKIEHYDNMVKMSEEAKQKLRRIECELEDTKRELKEVECRNKRLVETLNSKDNTLTEIFELRERDRILTALESGGVDNWEGYDVSLTEYLEEYKEEDVDT